jgi:hypothetical protein
MPKKINATKTLNPLHFEDLEPHRFEDLVRRLLYGFRDWRDIEATGRSGSDEGFDIRAWEKTDSITNVSDEGEEGEHLAEGNLWQVQGKREKSIGPSEMKAILEDVDATHPPYGYILAAATNISKKAYDVFRKELRKKGVREYHFWGKDHLEDQLALPENDEILFTFFGISLSPRRRSRAAEIKFSINNKNKMLKMLFDRGNPIDQRVRRFQSILLRDIKDRHYPNKAEYPDFDNHPRWGEYEVIHVNAAGVVFQAREFYAYLDTQKKEWDFSKVVDTTARKHNLDEVNERRLQDIGKKAESYWRHLPQRFQAKLIVYGFVSYEDILIVDERGDPEHAIPHVFLDYSYQGGPFAWKNAELNQRHLEPIYAGEFETQYKKLIIFPEEFPEPKQGKVHELDKLAPQRNLWAQLNEKSEQTIE